VDKLDDSIRSQFGPDYAFLFQYIYPRAYELRGTHSVSATSLSDHVAGTGQVIISPKLMVSRVITSSGQTLSWTTSNIDSLAYISTGPSGTKTATSLPLNKSPVFSPAATLAAEGWVAGSYSVAWTFIVNNISNTYTETFVMPAFSNGTVATITGSTLTVTETLVTGYYSEIL
jgi:hypothetical protein